MFKWIDLAKNTVVQASEVVGLKFRLFNGLRFSGYWELF